MQFVPNKSSIIALIRFFDLRFFSLPAKGRDKIVWSVRFRRARRTIVRRAAKSGAEKAKTLFRLLKESARIPTAFRNSDYTKAVIKKLVFAFSVCAFLASTAIYTTFTSHLHIAVTITY